MRVLVVGGSGSGKSSYAEGLAARLSGERTYVATMARDGHEAQARIERHRKQRAGLGFYTLECPCGRLRAPGELTEDVPQGVVLLDDVGNLAANALFSADGTMAEPAQVLERLEREVLALAEAFEHTVVVGNEVGSEGVPAYEGTLAWVRLVGSLCCRLAAQFDAVVEVVAGIPCVVKEPACEAARRMLREVSV